jgi:hypothetical protein
MTMGVEEKVVICRDLRVLKVFRQSFDGLINQALELDI